MKYLKYFLISGIAFMSLSSNKLGTTKPSEGIYPGDLFPEFGIIKNGEGTEISLADLNGQKVFVNFWAAYDAQSHQDNVLFSNILEKESYPVKMVSVSLDRSESVFAKTIIVDKVDKDNQFWADNSLQDVLTKRYSLNRGFKNYLLGETGKIIAMNIEPDNLEQLLKSN